MCQVLYEAFCIHEFIYLQLLVGWYYYIFYFIDKETGTKRLNDLLVSHNEQKLE